MTNPSAMTNDPEVLGRVNKTAPVPCSLKSLEGKNEDQSQEDSLVHLGSSTNRPESLAEALSEAVKREPLGEPFTAILRENLWDLYSVSEGVKENGNG